MDAERKEEMMRFAEEQMRQNPNLSREELERAICQAFYHEEGKEVQDAAAPLDEAQAPETLEAVSETPAEGAAQQSSKGTALSLRRKTPRLALWVSITLGILMTALIAFYLANPPGIPWPQEVRQVAKALGEEEEIEVVSQEEKEQYTAQVAEAIRLEGREVFLGRQLSDLINDAELAAVSVRLLKLNGVETAEKDKARVVAYIREHKLVLYCLVENNQLHWQKGPEEERYKRLKDAVRATDKHVDVLYKSMQWNDTATMVRAMDNVRQSYIMVGAFPF
ncbi:hypothetical protein [Azotosporobacter soli]|uniref:hypothetical protein n=1 Tax=Azotosporobacter soli TaxID=3055040 RepID=UPI0031FEAEC2